MKKDTSLPIVKLREEAIPKLSQKAVADHVGCTEKTYRSWESNASLPNTAALISLSELYGVSIDYLLGLSEYQHVEYKDVSSITGLSEAAISAIIDNHCADIVSLLVTQPEFLEIVDVLRRLTDKETIEQTELKNHVTGIWERGFKGQKYDSPPVTPALKYEADTKFRYILDRISEGSENNG